MGESFEAACRDCLHAFKAHDGGGFLFAGLHCHACGQYTTVENDLIREPNEQFKRGTSETLGLDDSGWRPPGALPLTDADRSRLRDAMAAILKRFDDAIEPIVGRCSCGGQFGALAPVRCPVCRSSNIERLRSLYIVD